MEFKISKLKSKAKPYLIVLAVIIGLVLGYCIFSIFVAKPKIALMKIEGPITSSDVDGIVSTLRQAKENTSIKALVLEINSPGGGASAIEEVYMETLDFRKTKPIVVAIDRLAASGAYYIAVASNFIYAKPSSDIGGIGVISVLPKPEKIEENVVITGPLKETGRTRKGYAAQVQLVMESFLEAVTFQRGDKLKLSKEELATAKIYSGIEAVQHGMIDGIGPVSDAITKAAQLAGIKNYQVADISKRPRIRIIISMSVNSSIFEPTNTVPIHYYLYMSGEQ